MTTERTYRIEITEAATNNGNTIEPGIYWVRIPASYDPDEVAGVDILCDGAITLVGPGDVSPAESCETLDGLLGLLRTDPEGLDWTDLRTFGGEAPADTSGVWSWDEDRILVGDGLADLRIEDRREEA